MLFFTFYSPNPVMNIAAILFFFLFLFLFFLLCVSIIAGWKQQKFKRPKVWPELSIILPVYNGSESILFTLESIKNSEYPNEKIEVIVIDDGSVDDTCDKVKAFSESSKRAGKRNKLSVSLFKQKHAGKVDALNNGIKKAKNDYIMTLDADVTVHRNAISLLVAPLLDKDIGATNAIAKIRKPRGVLENFQVLEFALNDLIRVSFSKVFNNGIWFYGAVACYRKDSLEKIKGFSKDTLTEDMDACLSLYDKGFRIVTVHDAEMHTLAVHSFTGLGKQRMRWYFGALQGLFKHRRLMASKKRSPAVLFLFFNQVWWTLFAFLFFPFTLIQIFYWLPSLPLDVLSYLVRWFSLAGPVYVLWMIPVWGINFLNIFGVLSGLITAGMIIAATKKFKIRWNYRLVLSLFFYFPYTIFQDLFIVFGVLKYSFSKKRYFKE